MHKLSVGLLIFTAGWVLGWYSHTQWHTDPLPPPLPVVTAPAKSAVPEVTSAESTPAAPDPVDNLASLLQRNEFEVVLQRYGALQAQGGDEAAADARTQILAHARHLIAESRFSPAAQLLQLFLVAAYHDAEARVLLAETYHGQKDLNTAIDQLYEAKGYAYRPDMLQQISRRIRNIVAELTQSLKHNNDQYALLGLYQHLTQLEPSHAPWFMGLAATQMALNDIEAARRSLQLVAQDPDVGAQAQAMLSKLRTALAQMPETPSQIPSTEVAGIPLYRSGNHFMVDATAARGQNIRLLIDTGATLTILTPDALEQGGIHYENTGRTSTLNTANGTVRAPIYRLDSLSVGDWQVDQIEIAVLDLGGSANLDGLLGMNFLRHFQFFIDQNAALLRLSVN